jgi:rod shape-determining protein MreD
LGAVKRILVLFLVILAQQALIPHAGVAGITPDLYLLFMLARARESAPYQGVLLGAGLGFFQDLMETGLFGVHTLAKSVAGYLSCLFPWVHRERNPLAMGAMLLILAACDQMITCLFYSRDAATGFFVYYIRYGFPSAVYTGLLGLTFFSLHPFVVKHLRKGR